MVAAEVKLELSGPKEMIFWKNKYGVFTGRVTGKRTEVPIKSKQTESGEVSGNAEAAQKLLCCGVSG